MPPIGSYDLFEYLWEGFTVAPFPLPYLIPAEVLLIIIAARGVLSIRGAGAPLAGWPTFCGKTPRGARRDLRSNKIKRETDPLNVPLNHPRSAGFNDGAGGVVERWYAGGQAATAQ